MTAKDIINAFVRLGEDIKRNIDTAEYRTMMSKAYNENAWFEIEQTKTALLNFLPWFDERVLTELADGYSLYDSFAKNERGEGKKILIVAAGNIPAVAFHDVVCVLLSGNTAVIKLSSVDKIIIPFLLNKLIGFLPEAKSHIIYTEGIVNISAGSNTGERPLVDGVIATGSNTSSLVFQQYFKDIPHIIRKSRHSIAVISDTNARIDGLEDDICLYFGLGCRSISHLFIPKGFDFDMLSHLTGKYSRYIHHDKYFNNYNYQKAVMMMNNIAFKETIPILLRENDELFSPISVVNYSYYDDITQVENIMRTHADDLQCVVTDKAAVFNDKSIKSFPLGTAQIPQMTDFADGVNTFHWLQTVERH